MNKFRNISIKLIFGYMLFLILTSTTAYSQSPCENSLCVVQYNASWNSAKSVVWMDKLTDCDIMEIDIASNTTAAGEYKIVVVPTIVIYDGGEEVKRFQANIMMTMEATKKEIQNAIDEILMEDF
jgi:hypothetical protein